MTSKTVSSEGKGAPSSSELKECDSCGLHSPHVAGHEGFQLCLRCRQTSSAENIIRRTSERLRELKAAGNLGSAKEVIATIEQEAAAEDYTGRIRRFLLMERGACEEREGTLQAAANAFESVRHSLESELETMELEYHNASIAEVRAYRKSGQTTLAIRKTEEALERLAASFLPDAFSLLREYSSCAAALASPRPTKWEHLFAAICAYYGIDTSVLQGTFGERIAEAERIFRDADARFTNLTLEVVPLRRGSLEDKEKVRKLVVEFLETEPVAYFAEMARNRYL